MTKEEIRQQDTEIAQKLLIELKGPKVFRRNSMPRREMTKLKKLDGNNTTNRK